MIPDGRNLPSVRTLVAVCVTTRGGIILFDNFICSLDEYRAFEFFVKASGRTTKFSALWASAAGFASGFSSNTPRAISSYPAGVAVRLD